MTLEFTPLEVPYALPPVRFEDPVALPEHYRYERKEYIQETACLHIMPF